MLFYASVIASVALIVAMKFKSKETPTNYILLAMFVSTVEAHSFITSYSLVPFLQCVATRGHTSWPSL